MKTSQILLPVVALTVALTIVWCSQPTTSDTAATTQVQQPLVALFNPVYASDSYVEYTPAALAKATANGKDTAVFFHSKTCGSCAKLDGDLKDSASNLPEDLVLFKADWNENQKLAWELNVAKYHTVAFYKEDWTTNNVKGLFTTKEVTEAFNTNVEEVIVENAGEYIVYTPAALAKATAEGKNTALFFHSKTCGSCEKLDNAINSDTADLPENMVVFKTDWDDNQELAWELNVAKYHTVAFMNDNGTSKNVSGLFTVSDLVAANSLK